MKEKLIMTPGPTYIDESVRTAMAVPITNPDLDLDFYEFYKSTCLKLSDILNTKSNVLILNGEGILGLEATCTSLIEKNDRVLCLDNGIFGNGFGDFIKMTGADVTYLSLDWREPFTKDKLETFLYENEPFDVATMVHCETPTGLINPIEDLCKVLKSHGILSIVDSVSAMGAYKIDIDNNGIDILLGGSQKCLSCPPGLTLMTISSDAWNKILNRKSKINSFYTNISLWKSWYEDKWFPYTQPISDIYALNKGLQNILDEGVDSFIKRHETLSKKTRDTLTNVGIELYPRCGFSNTVTAFLMPNGINAEEFRLHIDKKYNLILGGGLENLKNSVIRIGHMGENCYDYKLYNTFKILEKGFKDFGVNYDFINNYIN